MNDQTHQQLESLFKEQLIQIQQPLDFTSINAAPMPEGFEFPQDELPKFNSLDSVKLTFIFSNLMRDPKANQEIMGKYFKQFLPHFTFEEDFSAMQSNENQSVQGISWAIVFLELLKFHQKHFTFQELNEYIENSGVIQAAIDYELDSNSVANSCIKIFKVYNLFLQNYEARVKMHISTPLESKLSHIVKPINEANLEDMTVVTLIGNKLFDEKVIECLDKLHESGKGIYFAYSILLNELTRLRLYNNPIFTKLLEIVEKSIPSLRKADFGEFLRYYLATERIPQEFLTKDFLQEVDLKFASLLREDFLWDTKKEHMAHKQLYSMLVVLKSLADKGIYLYESWAVVMKKIALVPLHKFSPILPMVNRVLKMLKSGDQSEELLSFYKTYSQFVELIMSKITSESLGNLKDEDLAFIVNLVDLSEVNPSEDSEDPTNLIVQESVKRLEQIEESLDMKNLEVLSSFIYGFTKWGLVKKPEILTPIKGFARGYVFPVRGKERLRRLHLDHYYNIFYSLSLAQIDDRDVYANMIKLVSNTINRQGRKAARNDPMRWSIKTQGKLQQINYFLDNGDITLLPTNKLNNVHNQLHNSGSKAFSKLEFDVMNELDKKGYQYWTNFKLFGGLFKPKFVVFKKDSLTPLNFSQKEIESGDAIIIDFFDCPENDYFCTLPINEDAQSNTSEQGPKEWWLEWFRASIRERATPEYEFRKRIYENNNIGHITVRTQNDVKSLDKKIEELSS
ncbi:unnamed protein product [Moneuplotes crassus]|uniref:Uncharacterized protein n=2 Tax=Euplotes crassus TaxID=5936 RepID=A0AAD2CZS0_EUPCR|nr:unnamed protein product [Moneuplotes crassus]